MKGAVLRTYLAGGGEAALGLPEGVEVKSLTYSAYWQGTERGNVWWSRADGGRAVPDTKTVRLRGARGNFRDVVWSDAAGDTISTSSGALSAHTEDQPWITFDEPTIEIGCRPVGAFTAPTGAVFARPFAQIVTSDPYGFARRVSQFRLVQG